MIVFVVTSSQEPEWKRNLECHYSLEGLELDRTFCTADNYPKLLVSHYEIGKFYLVPRNKTIKKKEVRKFPMNEVLFSYV